MEKTKTKTIRKTDEFADISIRRVPTKLRHDARSKAFHLNLTLREFFIEALKEKIASSS